MCSDSSLNPIALAAPIALEWLESPDSFVQNAYEAVEKTGFEAGAASKGPFARLNEFLEEQVWPHLEPSIDMVRAMAAEAAENLRAFGDAIREERFSGEIVQRAIITAGWADALQRVLPAWLEGQFSFSSFSATEWLYLALAVSMFAESRGD